MSKCIDSFLPQACVLGLQRMDIFVSNDLHLHHHNVCRSLLANSLHHYLTDSTHYRVWSKIKVGQLNPPLSQRSMKESTP